MNSRGAKGISSNNDIRALKMKDGCSKSSSDCCHSSAPGSEPQCQQPDGGTPQRNGHRAPRAAAPTDSPALVNDALQHTVQQSFCSSVSETSSWRAVSTGCVAKRYRSGGPGGTFPLQPTQSANDISESARGFSFLTDPEIIKRVCISFVPGWTNLITANLYVYHVLAGLSNQLFKVTLDPDCPEAQHSDNDEDALPQQRVALHDNSSTSLNARHSGNEPPKTRSVLFRLYGKDIATLYDPVNEVQIFSRLSKRNVSPKLIASFDGGRIEEWLSGSPLTIYEMGEPTVLHNVAEALATLHRMDFSKEVPVDCCLWRRLDHWRDNALKILERVPVSHPTFLPMMQLHLPRLIEESYCIQSVLYPPNAPACILASDLCFCHNDIQENNIMTLDVQSRRLRLIDFEFSGYSFAAFDIASYFWEMTCDYCWEEYPYFFIDPLLYPSEHTRRRFIAVYLTARLARPVHVGDEEVTEGLHAVERFLLVAHMLWAFWAVIRAPQAATATAFDMLHYALKRADAYWYQKAKLVDSKLLPAIKHELFPRDCYADSIEEPVS